VTRSALNFAHIVKTKRQQHRFFEPLIDAPGTVACPFGDAGRTAVQQIERLLDRFADKPFGGGAQFIAPIEGRIDCLGELD